MNQGVTLTRLWFVLSLVLYLGTKMVPLTGSMNSDDVAECYEQALFSIFPKSRYTVGVDAMFYLLASYLPTIVSDVVYRMPGLRAVPQHVQRPAPQYVQLSRNGEHVPSQPVRRSQQNSQGGTTTPPVRHDTNGIAEHSNASDTS